MDFNNVCENSLVNRKVGEWCCYYYYVYSDFLEFILYFNDVDDT